MCELMCAEMALKLSRLRKKVPIIVFTLSLSTWMEGALAVATLTFAGHHRSTWEGVFAVPNASSRRDFLWVPTVDPLFYWDNLQVQTSIGRCNVQRQGRNAGLLHYRTVSSQLNRTHHINSRPPKKS